MKEFHREDFANLLVLAQAWTVKSADRLFTVLRFFDHLTCVQRRGPLLVNGCPGRPSYGLARANHSEVSSRAFL